MRRTTILLIGIIATFAIVSVSAGGPYHEEGFFSSLAHRVNGWMPWGSKLGHDHTDTLDKVEHIYQSTHAEAQRRVDELKENIVKDSDIQKLIADIYLEEAERAEREIEALKHPMLEWLTHWKKHNTNTGSVSSSAASYAASAKSGVDKVFDAAGKAYDAKGMASKWKSDFEEIPSKISGHYRTALDSAKKAAASLPVSASGTWEDTKHKANEIYSHAFHKGHGETRTFLGKLRDSLGRGGRGTASFVKAAASTTWDFVTHIFMASFYLLAGAALAAWGLALWRRRKFEQQLDARVSGPIIAVGEYTVMGNEEMQRKFYEFWSGPAAAYFNRQTGMRRQYMHRGVPGAGNTWLSVSEWATIEDLRRACKSTEFCELKNRAPKATTHKMTLYQLGANTRLETEGEALKETADQRIVRQRMATTT